MNEIISDFIIQSIYIFALIISEEILIVTLLQINNQLLEST